MKNFKKITAVLLAVLLVAALAACGAKPDPAPSGKKYVIASDNAFAPFEYLNTDTNEYVGIDMDILAAVAEDQKFDYEVQNVGFDAALNQVQSGQADAVIAGMTITDERRLPQKSQFHTHSSISSNWFTLAGSYGRSTRM